MSPEFDKILLLKGIKKDTYICTKGELRQGLENDD
jgi:hypothetical protein